MRLEGKFNMQVVTSATKRPKQCFENWRGMRVCFIAGMQSQLTTAVWVLGSRRVWVYFQKAFNNRNMPESLMRS
jgi:hypothetical protein